MSPLLFARGGFLLGLALGAGVVAVAPKLARVAKPVAKDAAKASKAGYDVARDAVVKARRRGEGHTHRHRNRHQICGRPCE